MKRIFVFVLTFILLSSCTLTALTAATPAVQNTPVPELAAAAATCPPVCPTCPPANCPTCAANPQPDSPADPTATFTTVPIDEITATHTPEVTESQEPTEPPVAKPYSVKDSPIYLQNIHHPEKKCEWMGVGGQVLDESGKWVPNVVVIVQGTIDGEAVDILGLSGTATRYGPGGYDILLSDRVVNSTNSLYIVLKDLQGNELTSPLYFSTLADCNKNQILINFQKTLVQ